MTNGRNGYVSTPILPAKPHIVFAGDKYPNGTKILVSKGDKEWLFANDVQARKFVSSNGELPTRESVGVLWLPEEAFA